MENLAQMISSNIKKEVESSTLSKTEIAFQIGISKPTLSQYLSGQIHPSLETFAKLCRVLDCSADDLLGLKKY